MQPGTFCFGLNITYRAFEFGAKCTVVTILLKRCESFVERHASSAYRKHPRTMGRDPPYLRFGKQIKAIRSFLGCVREDDSGTCRDYCS